MKSLYDKWLDQRIGTWSAYQTANGRRGTMVMDLFQTDVYTKAWLVLALVTFITCFLYYFYFNKRFGNYYSLGSYFKFLFISMVLIGILTWLLAFLTVHGIPAPTGSLIGWLTLINIIYALLGFIGFSLVCQGFAIVARKFLAVDFSPMGNRTPL